MYFWGNLASGRPAIVTSEATANTSTKTHWGERSLAGVVYIVRYCIGAILRSRTTWPFFIFFVVLSVFSTLRGVFCRENDDSELRFFKFLDLSEIAFRKPVQENALHKNFTFLFNFFFREPRHFPNWPPNPFPS